MKMKSLALLPLCLALLCFIGVASASETSPLKTGDIVQAEKPVGSLSNSAAPSALDLALKLTLMEVKVNVARMRVAPKVPSPISTPESTKVEPGTVNAEAQPPFYVNPLSRTIHMVRERIEQIQTPVSDPKIVRQEQKTGVSGVVAESKSH